jgi:hypothetical protein
MARAHGCTKHVKEMRAVRQQHPRIQPNNFSYRINIFQIKTSFWKLSEWEGMKVTGIFVVYGGGLPQRLTIQVTQWWLGI